MSKISGFYYYSYKIIFPFLCLYLCGHMCGVHVHMYVHTCGSPRLMTESPWIVFLPYLLKARSFSQTQSSLIRFISLANLIKDFLVSTFPRSNYQGGCHAPQASLMLVQQTFNYH